MKKVFTYISASVFVILMYLFGMGLFGFFDTQFGFFLDYVKLWMVMLSFAFCLVMLLIDAVKGDCRTLFNTGFFLKMVFIPFYIYVFVSCLFDCGASIVFFIIFPPILLWAGSVIIYSVLLDYLVLFVSSLFVTMGLCLNKRLDNKTKIVCSILSWIYCIDVAAALFCRNKDEMRASS